MDKTREKLLNANEFCHIYEDDYGVTNIHITKNNETYRLIPKTHALGFQIERHKNGRLVSRNTISYEEMRVLADLAGSNDLLTNLDGQGGEVNRTSD